MAIYTIRIHEKQHQLTKSQVGEDACAWPLRCMRVTLSQVAPGDRCQTGRKRPMPVTMATEPRKPQYLHISEGTCMSRWKVGSMVRINGLSFLNGVNVGVITYNPLILTIDPNFLQTSNKGFHDSMLIFFHGVKSSKRFFLKKHGRLSWPRGTNLP